MEVLKASLLFPVWWFLRHPRSTVICASHSLGLARSFGRRARDLVQQHAEGLGFAIKPNHRAADNWSTTEGGEYLAVGVRGSIVGRRADLIIIDDPVKSHAIADSKRQRDFIWEWYKSDVSTRLKPGGRVALVMTRWHKDDLGGQLEATAEDGWRVLRLPALAEAGDPLGRAPRRTAVAGVGGQSRPRPPARPDRRLRLGRAVSAKAARAVACGCRPT